MVKKSSDLWLACNAQIPQLTHVVCALQWHCKQLSGCGLVPFGSRCVGNALPTSDVDLCWQVCGNIEGVGFAAEKLQLLNERIHMRDILPGVGCLSTILILTSIMPRLVVTVQGLLCTFDITCDIPSHSGRAMVHFIREAVENRLLPLSVTRLIKAYLHYMGVHGTYYGGISSSAINVMLMGMMCGTRSQHPATLLSRFMKLFGLDLDMKSTFVSTAQICEDSTNGLFVEDPLDKWNNLASSAFNLSQVQVCFQGCAVYLGNACDRNVEFDIMQRCHNFWMSVPKLV